MSVTSAALSARSPGESAMSAFVVTVEFQIAPGRLPAFLPLMIENAESSRREPGCRRFDVCRDRARPDIIFLYEIYDDEAAFKAHLDTSHFKAFATATGDMIAGRRVTFCDLLA